MVVSMQKWLTSPYAPFPLLANRLLKQEANTGAELQRAYVWMMGSTEQGLAAQVAFALS